MHPPPPPPETPHSPAGLLLPPHRAADRSQQRARPAALGAHPGFGVTIGKDIKLGDGQRVAAVAAGVVAVPAAAEQIGDAFLDELRDPVDAAQLQAAGGKPAGRGCFFYSFVGGVGWGVRGLARSTLVTHNAQ